MNESQRLLDREKLRDKRIRAGWSRAELARRANLHSTHIDMLERGLRGTSPKTLNVLADVLGCDITDLMPDKAAA